MNGNNSSQAQSVTKGTWLLFLWFRCCFYKEGCTQTYWQVPNDVVLLWETGMVPGAAALPVPQLPAWGSQELSGIPAASARSAGVGVAICKVRSCPAVNGLALWEKVVLFCVVLFVLFTNKIPGERQSFFFPFCSCFLQLHTAFENVPLIFILLFLFCLQSL